MAMAKVMVSASAGAMNSVIVKLTQLLADEYQLIRSVKRGIKFLVEELDSMNALLERLAGMEKIDVQTRQWRDRVRDMSYDMEDCIDRYMQRHSNPGPGGPRTNFVRKIKRKINKIWGDRQMGKEIKELKALVEAENDRHARYKIDQRFTEPVTLEPQAYRHYELSRDLVGIDGPREEILGWLSEEDPNPKVVAIYGIGGSGKTTLAHMVYNRIKESFDCGVYITVSRTPNVKSLLSDMLSQLDTRKYQQSQMWEKEQLIRILRELLQNKRYLIFIDDIWSTSAWEDVISALPVNNNQSRIITTTRKKDVARSCCTVFNGRMYDVRPLSEDDSRILFFGRAFSSEHCPPELRGIANEILRKCAGLPLAIISIAGLLASKGPKLELWVKIRNSISFAVEEDSPVDKMKRILFVSYFDLPHYLQSCLLYLSVFPEDYDIDIRLLICAWIAEGLITGVNRKDMELRGEWYLNELINRSLIQPRKIGADGTTVKFCRVHDIIHEFIISHAVEENFIAILNGDGLCKKDSPNKIRRLSIQSNFFEAPDLLMKDLSHLRSLHIFGSLPGCDQVPQNCESLRVLNIEGVLDLNNHHIKHIGSFSQLRYLRIVGVLSPTGLTKGKTKRKRNWSFFMSPTVASISELPAQIGNLQHLEVLDLRRTNIRKAPATFVQLQKLVCLFVNGLFQLPDGIGNMQSLEELSDFSHREASIRSIQGLGELTKLRVLRIGWSMYEVDESRMEACISSLSRLVAKSLQSLHLTDFESSDVTDWVLPSGSIPPLKRLVLCGVPNFEFPAIPRQIGSLVNLTRLSISLVHELGEEGIKILGSLPALVSLTLMLGYGVRQNHFIGSQGFQRLVKFHFMGETSLIFEARAMPKLQRLKLKLTKSEQYNPGGLLQGLHHLSSIKHFTISVYSSYTDSSYMEALEDEIRSAASIHPNRPIVEIGGPLGPQTNSDDDEGNDDEEGCYHEEASADEEGRLEGSD